jgi:hypothetical protein
VPKRQPKRRRLWLGDGSCIRLRPQYRGHVWSYDFVVDRRPRLDPSVIYQPIASTGEMEVPSLGVRREPGPLSEHICFETFSCLTGGVPPGTRLNSLGRGKWHSCPFQRTMSQAAGDQCRTIERRSPDCCSWRNPPFASGKARHRLYVDARGDVVDLGKA